jgi:hypothetical protein
MCSWQLNLASLVKMPLDNATFIDIFISRLSVQIGMLLSSTRMYMLLLLIYFLAII